MKMGPGSCVGIVGLGGLGLTGVQIATAMGCKVTGISRTDGKRKLAEEAGAVGFVATSDPASMGAAVGSLDMVRELHDIITFSVLVATHMYTDI